MMQQSDVLHITPHLGGGVGSSMLASLSLQAKEQDCFRHKVISLEKNKTRKFFDGITDSGIAIIENPDVNQIEKEIQQSEILQLEWWNHPQWFPLFSCLPEINTRIVLRPHINGLNYPIIPDVLSSLADAVALTGRVVPESMAERKLHIPIEWIPSVVDLSHYAIHRTGSGKKFVGGYCGTYDYGKLHPDYLSFLNKSIHLFDEFWFVGDWKDNTKFSRTIKRHPQFGAKIRCVEFAENILPIYEKLDCLLYLLNPYHYGTTENVLLEAMAAGVVPIVLNNPIESAIVKDGRNGLVICNEDDLARGVGQLRSNRPRLLALGRHASQDVQEQFKLDISVHAMNTLYEYLKKEPKSVKGFATLFGPDPKSWYEASLPKDTDAISNRDPYANYIHQSPTKGSQSHFQHYFGRFKP